MLFIVVEFSGICCDNDFLSYIYFASVKRIEVYNLDVQENCFP